MITNLETTIEPSQQMSEALLLEHRLRLHKRTKVLIVKLGWSETLVSDSSSMVCSLGDVLRTTPILHLYRDDEVTWLTDAKAVQLLPGKPWIDELIPYTENTSLELFGRRFDTVVNLECDDRIADMLGGIRYRKWYGFPIWQGKVLNQAEMVTDTNQPMDGLSGKNWSEQLFEMVGEKFTGQTMIMGGTLTTSVTHDIGFNIHVGPKWPTKAWPTKNWDRLEKKLKGRYTIEYQKYLNNLDNYKNWVNQCRLLVTNDSLGLHIAQALGKSVVALFGPTDHATITPDENLICLHRMPMMRCQPCYKSSCHQGCECMSSISVEEVADAIERLLG